MKAAYAAGIAILAFSLSACVTGDKITSYVIDPDGSIAFSIYRLNLTSGETGEKAKGELAQYIRDLEEDPGSPFAKANAKEVTVTVLRRAAPASVLITGRFPSLDDFAAYLTEEDKEVGRLVCTPIARERTRGFLLEFNRKPPKENLHPTSIEPRADSFEETRIALAEGIFTRAQGYILSDNKRSALLDADALLKKWNSQDSSISISLEWQLHITPQPHS
jgi:hypothetical protein